MAAASGSSFVSPAANAENAPGLASRYATGFVSNALDGITPWRLLFTLVFMAVLYDQFRYVWDKGSIMGPKLKLPFMGPFLEAIYPEFEKYLAKWNSGELSCVSVFHKFVVIASTRDIARKVFNSPAYLKPCVVDVAVKLLRPNNWVFLDGKAHVDYRKGLNGLFTRKALELYLPGQEEIYDKYFARFLQITKDAGGKPVPFMPEFREINCAISCRTFVGHYMSEQAVKKIAVDYYNITAALDLVNFPIILPFTRPWYGKKAADMVVDEFTRCAAKSKVRMRAGGEVTCILDGWVKTMFESEDYRARIARGEEATKPVTLLRVFTDLEIALTLLTFLFASQDASSSATTWLFQIMADRPDLLAKLRAEQLAVRDGDVHRRLTLDILDKMPYTRAVVKEVLRYRPPVIMVPYVAKKAFPITATYTVPKGSMVVPCVYPALHDPDVYPDPESFDPERWISGTAEKASKNWLVFGTGPHYCLGQTYAQLNLMALIGKASLLLDWEHQITDKSEEIKVFATIFPMDDCLLSFQERRGVE
ncbi:MAG: RNA polymerase C-22 sterol desaturase [Piccolia ochrophora]|nr:MAG: RNA polymerase C-22 sterol desaturase [Piccolia ochrophora]